MFNPDEPTRSNAAVFSLRSSSDVTSQLNSSDVRSELLLIEGNLSK